MATTVRSLIVTIVPLLLAAGACRGNSPITPATTQTPSAAAPGQPAASTGCAATSVGLAPLSDLGSGTYQGQTGGLYPGGANVRPSSHEASGIALARAIQPMNGVGEPSAAGRYVLVSIGMSNTTQEFSTFKPLADGDGQKDPRLAIVDGAQGGMTGSDWASPGCSCWTVLDQRLTAAGVTANQVAIAWVKLAERQPSEGWPLAARILQGNIVTVAQRLKQRFPNLQLAYLSSRIYAGYATTNLNPEPYAYESGFAVRWAIEEMMNGPNVPWVSWGPYLWADGLKPRGDGLAWTCGDLSDDGTHPSATGRRKVADMLLAFFKSDATAREWFLANP